MARIELPAMLQTLTGNFGLRPEQAADAAFLRQLFDTSRPLTAQLAHLPGELREMVLQGQFQAQCQGYLAQFPHARGFIVQDKDEPVGHLLFDEENTGLHIIDLALLPQWRGQGIGTSLLLHLAGAAVPRGLSLSVAGGNEAARRLYARLGFVATVESPGYLHLARPAV